MPIGFDSSSETLTHCSRAQACVSESANTWRDVTRPGITDFSLSSFRLSADAISRHYRLSMWICVAWPVRLGECGDTTCRSWGISHKTSDRMLENRESCEFAGRGAATTFGVWALISEGLYIVEVETALSNNHPQRACHRLSASHLFFYLSAHLWSCCRHDGFACCR